MAEDTRAKHLEAYKWKPGQSGNVHGRPLGARNRLGEAFLADLHADWLQHGSAVVVAAREKDPVAYLRVVASVLPKEVAVTVEFRDQLAAFLGGMTDITPNSDN